MSLSTWTEKLRIIANIRCRLCLTCSAQHAADSGRDASPCSRMHMESRSHKYKLAFPSPLTSAPPHHPTPNQTTVSDTSAPVQMIHSTIRPQKKQWNKEWAQHKTTYTFPTARLTNPHTHAYTDVCAYPRNKQKKHIFTHPLSEIRAPFWASKVLISLLSMAARLLALPPLTGRTQVRIQAQGLSFALDMVWKPSSAHSVDYSL